MSDFKQNIQEAHSDLVETKTRVLSTLDHPELGVLSLGIRADLERVINKLAFLGGLDTATTTAQDYPPIEAEGDVLEVLAVNVNPDEETKALFLSKVDKLWKDIEVLSSEVVLKDYQSKEDQLVIRGVAKRAGQADFADAELNVFYIDQLKTAVAFKNEADAEQAKVTAQLDKDANLEDLKNRLAVVENKRAALKADLKEAEANEAKATKAADKTKAAGIVKSIREEMVLADELHEGLAKELEGLNA
jgi:hypothetical protein